MMGGHGFSSYSKMGVLINDNEINSTWEGDNNILLQQTTKILLENMQRVMKGKEIQINILKFMANVIFLSLFTATVVINRRIHLIKPYEPLMVETILAMAHFLKAAGNGYENDGSEAIEHSSFRHMEQEPTLFRQDNRTDAWRFVLSRDNASKDPWNQKPCQSINLYCHHTIVDDEGLFGWWVCWLFGTWRDWGVDDGVVWKVGGWSVEDFGVHWGRWSSYWVAFLWCWWQWYT